MLRSTDCCPLVKHVETVLICFQSFELAFLSFISSLISLLLCQFDDDVTCDSMTWPLTSGLLFLLHVCIFMCVDVSSSTSLNFVLFNFFFFTCNRCRIFMIKKGQKYQHRFIFGPTGHFTDSHWSMSCILQFSGSPVTLEWSCTEVPQPLAPRLAVGRGSLHIGPQWKKR